MIGDSVLVNGRLVSRESVSFALDDAEVCYGYGCYETLKVRAGLLYFAPLHAERLLSSAEILGIGHGLLPEGIVGGLERLVAANGLADCNIRLMLVGREGRAADCYAFLLPALRPPEAAATEGVDCLVYRGERQFPRAKSLSMLLSTIAFKAAAKRGCWDALLVNRRGEITEGTRTNVFYLETGRPQILFTPPAEDCLPGITKRTLTEALAGEGIQVRERPLSLEAATSGSLSILVTSTSSLLLPIRGLLDEDSHYALPRHERIGELEAIYAAYLHGYEAKAGPSQIERRPP